MDKEENSKIVPGSYEFVIADYDDLRKQLNDMWERDGNHTTDNPFHLPNN